MRRGSASRRLDRKARFPLVAAPRSGARFQLNLHGGDARHRLVVAPPGAGMCVLLSRLVARFASESAGSAHVLGARVIVDELASGDLRP